MEIGVFIFPTDLSMSPIELAHEVEVRGFESLWFPEHTHVPTIRATPWPGAGDELPTQYFRAFDPFATIAACAAVTTKLRLGTSICLVAQHDTITLAKQVATVDQLSGGRFEFGIGYGWNIEEMAAHGVVFASRRRVVRERLLAMERLWQDEIAEFHGEFVELAPSWMWPKPVQTPRPPVLIGGIGGPKLVDQIVELADGWMSIPGGSIVDTIGRLRIAADAIGRDPSTISTTAWGAAPRVETLVKNRDLGVQRSILLLPSDSRDVVLPVLDRLAALVREY